MRYDLMHKDIKVAEMMLNEDDGTVNRLEHVENLDHMPVGTVIKGFIDGIAFKNWWRARAIPASRSGIRDILLALDIPSTVTLISRCMGLSLSDHYWIRAQGSDVEWKDVNFFDNDFSDDVGDMLFGMPVDVGNMSFSSPDNTSDGVLKKRWKIIDGKRCLIKGGSGQNMQEPFNEVIASILMSSQGIDHTDYRMQWIKDYPHSVCDDFVTAGSELVAARDVIRSRPKMGNDSLYDHYCNACSDMGVYVSDFLDRLLVIDYIMMNNDRHTGNFGLLRDPESLEYLCTAPVYDTGTSLQCNLRTDRFRIDMDHSSKPFRDTFVEQIKLVRSFDWFDADAMRSVLPDVAAVLDDRGFIGEERKRLIMDLLDERIGSMERLSSQKS